MPHNLRRQTVYIPTGNPDTYNSSTIQYAGELGMAFDYNDRSYQIVKLDSGATAVPTVGAVAANQLAFWKDRSVYLVTNDKRFALLGGAANSFMNNVAGVFRTAVTAGNYCAILQRGYNIPAAVATADEAAVVGGASIIADVTANTASVDGVAVATSPTHQLLGYCKTASSSNVAYVNFDITPIP